VSRRYARASTTSVAVAAVAVAAAMTTKTVMSKFQPELRSALICGLLWVVSTTFFLLSSPLHLSRLAPHASSSFLNNIIYYVIGIVSHLTQVRLRAPGSVRKALPHRPWELTGYSYYIFPTSSLVIGIVSHLTQVRLRAPGSVRKALPHRPWELTGYSLHLHTTSTTFSPTFFLNNN